MNGVDAIVFTAGIGENAIPVREKVVSYLDILELHLTKKLTEFAEKRSLSLHRIPKLKLL